eukprot:XP_001707438.1 Hypothetical protein GL50803_39158 [Giardia lamblia ATCC 50803]
MQHDSSSVYYSAIHVTRKVVVDNDTSLGNSVGYRDSPMHQRIPHDVSDFYSQIVVGALNC